MNNNISFYKYQQNFFDNSKFTHISYPIKLNTSLNKINLSEKTNVYICTYSIITSSNIQLILKPYLQFFFYKFTENHSEFKDYFIFPFLKCSSNPINNANKLFHSIFNIHSKPKGFIQNQTCWRGDW